MDINPSGYLITFLLNNKYRSYACANLQSLEAIILSKTGRPFDTFPLGKNGLPKSKDFVIGYPLQILS